MSRTICPHLYPDTRPSRFFRPALAEAPRLRAAVGARRPLALRLLPALLTILTIAAITVLALTALPVLIWLLLALIVLLPVTAGVVLYRAPE